MPRKRATKEELAEAVTGEARQFVRLVRRSTRRRFTTEEKVRVVLQGLRREAPQLSRAFGCLLSIAVDRQRECSSGLSG
jgi:transposase-like protein